jgi:hypothetical protein
MLLVPTSLRVAEFFSSRFSHLHIVSYKICLYISLPYADLGTSTYILSSLSFLSHPTHFHPFDMIILQEFGTITRHKNFLSCVFIHSPTPKIIGPSISLSTAFSLPSLKTYFAVLPSSTYLFTAGVEVVYFDLITLKHTPQSVGLLWTRDRPIAETSTCQHKHSQETNIHAPVGFEPATPASARPQTHALDRAATGIGFP